MAKTRPTEASLTGRKYYNAGDVNGPTLADQGARDYVLKQGSAHVGLEATIADVRKPLMAVADLVDQGYDVHFLASGQHHAKRGNEVLHFVRRGGKFELDAKVLSADSFYKEHPTGVYGLNPGGRSMKYVGLD